METKTFDFTVGSAWGQEITPIEVSAEYTHYTSLDEVREAGEYPSDKDILGFVNAKSKANARSKATASALDKAGHKKPTLDDAQFRLKEMIKVLVASGRDAAEAQQVAESVLGVKLEK